MVLKIDNNLITPSHITEGERVNDTYFDGKYKLMLPNSEHRYLTSDKERKQLLSESTKSNLYAKETLGHISQNTTTGKMFEEEIVSETHTKATGFEQYKYLYYTPAVTYNTVNQFEMQFVVKTPSSFSSAGRIINDANSYDNFKINCANGEISAEIAGNIILASSNLATDTLYYAKFTYDGTNMVGRISTNGIDWTIGETKTMSFSMNYSKFCLGGRNYDNYYECVFTGTIYLDLSYVEVNNNKVVMKDVYENPNGITISEETFTTRTVTQKPFEQSVTINSSELQEGTKYLVDYPGMFQLKTEDNTLAVKFLFEESPVWKYIKEEELVEGDNVLKLTSDTEKLKFIVNTTEHTLVDSTITEEQKYIVNGTNNNYIQLNVFDHQDLPWEIEIFAKYGSAVSSYSRIIDGPPRSFLIGYIDSGSSKNMGFYLSSNGSSWDIYGSSSLGKYLELNKNYYYKLVFDGFSYKYYYKEENASEYTLIVNVNSSTKINKTNICLYGSIENPTTNENTKVNISKTKIKINGEMWFDGATAVEGVDYTVVGSPTIETKTVHIDGEIPELTAGYLGYREGWKL